MNPLSLIDNKNLQIKFEYDSHFIAKTEKCNDMYIISISTYYLDGLNLSEKSMLIKGFKFHEIAHIKYKSFSVNIQVSALFAWLFNVIEDERIEYQLSLHYPLAAKYFNLVLSLMQGEIKVGLKVKNEEAEKIEDDIKKKISILFDFVRYGKEDSKEEEFIDFLRPLILSSKRGDVKNCYLVCIAIYRYIIFESDRANNFLNSQIITATGNKQEVREKIEEQFEGDSGVVQEIKQIEEQERANKQAGKITDTRNSFQQVTVMKDHEIIRKLINIFKVVTTSHSFNPALEGEINFKKIQEAYINSFTGEEGYNFFSYKLLEVCFDAIIIRDVSGSTWNMRNEYAQATIDLVAAISYFKQNRVACIDFDCHSKILKRFEDKEQFNIMPYDGGSTNLTGALKRASELKWKNKKKFVIIICDGYPNDLSSSLSEIKNNNFYKGVKIIGISLLTDKKLFDSSIIVNDIKDLPDSILKAILGGE